MALSNQQLFARLRRGGSNRRAHGSDRNASDRKRQVRRDSGMETPTSPFSPQATAPTPSMPTAGPNAGPSTTSASGSPSYVGNIGLGGFDQFDERRSGGAGNYERSDASTDLTNPANVAAEIMSKDSRLMQAAETKGLQAANRRGILNTSMAVGASQDAVLDEVVPLATQEAGQRFESNRAKQDFGLGSLMSRQEYEQRLAEGEQGFGFDLGLLNREGEINSGRDKANFGYERELEQLRLDYARTEAARDRVFDRDSQLLDIDARFDLADMDAGIRRELMQMESDMRVRLQRAEAALDGQNISTEAFLTARDQYNQRVTNIMNNPDMSDEERRDAIAAEQANLDTDIRTIEDLYSIDLPWTEDYQPTTGESAVYRDVAAAYEEILGRSPDTGGSNFWTQQILSGNATIEDVRSQLRASPEGRGSVRYNPTTGKLEEPGRQTTTSRTETTRNNTAPSTQPAPTPVTDKLAQKDLSLELRRAFVSELGRLPDSGGYQFWYGQLTSGRMTIDQVRAALADSPEGRGEMKYDRETRQLVPV